MPKHISIADRKPYYKNYKFEPHEVLHVRLIRRYTGMSYREIAEGVRCSTSHIGNICKYRRWSDLK